MGSTSSNDNLPELYDFFEQAMIAATFSFQSLEVFCNDSISRYFTEPVSLERHKELVSLTPEELERRLSTSDKLTQLMPMIHSVSTPKGKAVWRSFKDLQKTRDAVIHLKSRDQKGDDEGTLFSVLLSMSASKYPDAAVEMIHHFYGTAKHPRWLELFHKRHK